MCADAAINREEDLANNPAAAVRSDTDEESDSDSPIFDMFFQQGGSALTDNRHQPRLLHDL